MPKFSSILSVNTAMKVGAGAAAGYFGTIVVSSYTSSTEESAKTEMREEGREEREKKLNFEVEQRSKHLEEKERDLKSLEETLSKQAAALREERLAVQQMQTATVAVTEEADGVATKTVQTVKEPADLKVEQRETVVPEEKPTEYVPRRPQVFDGGGREPVASNKESTASEPKLLYFNDPSFATDRIPFAEGRDVRPLLSPPVPKARRFTKQIPHRDVWVER